MALLLSSFLIGLGQVYAKRYFLGIVLCLCRFNWEGLQDLLPL